MKRMTTHRHDQSGLRSFCNIAGALFSVLCVFNVFATTNDSREVHAACSKVLLIGLANSPSNTLDKKSDTNAEVQFVSLTNALGASEKIIEARCMLFMQIMDLSVSNISIATFCQLSRSEIKKDVKKLVFALENNTEQESKSYYELEVEVAKGKVATYMSGRKEPYDSLVSRMISCPEKNRILSFLYIYAKKIFYEELCQAMFEKSIKKTDSLRIFEMLRDGTDDREL